MRLLNENHYSNEYLFISFMQLYVRLYFHDYSFEDHLSLKARTKRSSQKKKKKFKFILESSNENNCGGKFFMLTNLFQVAKIT